MNDIVFSASDLVVHELGKSPLILCAPHDGTEKPDGIPTRKMGYKIRDVFTGDIVWGIHDTLVDKSELSQLDLPGKKKHIKSKPHVIMLKLHRCKVDVNRKRENATDNNSPEAVAVWDVYHSAIQNSIDLALRDFGYAVLLDIHGQSHRNEIELGYLLDKTHLRCVNTEQFSTLCKSSSLHSMLGLGLRPAELSEIIRGPGSFGTLLCAKGYPTIPSVDYPHPCKSSNDHKCTKECKFYSGGYTVRRYSSTAGVCCIQIETPSCERWDGREPLEDSLTSISRAIARTYKEFIELHFSKM